MKRSLVALGVLLTFAVLFATSLHAQEAPPPHKSPRTPVHREVLTSKTSEPESRILQGPVLIIDTERLRIGETDMRLFGVVPPQLSASFGPQARAALDSVTAGKEISCQIRDRDHDGRFLATCKTPNNDDLALALLQRGLAVSARGSLSGTDLLIGYIAAEQAAQAQKIGLWSVVVPSAVNMPESTKGDVLTPQTTSAAPPASLAAKIEAHEDKPAAKTIFEDSHPAKITPTPLLIPTVAATAAQGSLAGRNWDSPPEPGFIAHYQILITGLLILVTALSILGVLSSHRRSDKREELRAMTAAICGELMAARAVCQTRLRSIQTDEDDLAVTWPRIRSTLYQAYVGRIGALGTELARKIASIYGQSSDYAAYYNSNDTERSITNPKRQGLETLIHHIETILPKLAAIEHTGSLPAKGQRSTSVRPKTFPGSPSLSRPMHLEISIPRETAPSEPSYFGYSSSEPSTVNSSSDSSEVSSYSEPTEIIASDVPQDSSQTEPVPPPPDTTTSPEAAIENLSRLARADRPTTSSARQASAPDSIPHENTPSSTVAPTSRLSVSPIPLWKAMRNFTRERMIIRQDAHTEQPDYNAMLEEEMANISFTDSDELPDTSGNSASKFGNRQS